MTDIMHVEGLCIAFGGLKAVDGVSFTAERNKITTVIGPNGAGKTTLFNLISGALKPSGGRVIIKGKDVTGKGPAALQEAGLARSFQITNLFFEMTVRENLRLAAQRLSHPLHDERAVLLEVGAADGHAGRLIDHVQSRKTGHDQRTTFFIA